MSAMVKVIQPVGVLDSTNGSQLRRDVLDTINAGTGIILIDCKQVTFMDSSGLGALVMALKTARSAGGRLAVCSINEQVRLLFNLTSMDQVFEVFPDQEEFHRGIAATP